MAQFTPSEEAWTFFQTHADNIRDIVGMFANEDLGKYDDFVEAKDTHAMIPILNKAWSAAPEAMSTRRIPGFMEMCNLLDGSVDGFFDEEFDNLTGIDIPVTASKLLKKD